MTTETEADWANEIGKPAYESIAEMVAALECDYDRLEELRSDREDYTPPCTCKAKDHGPDTCDQCGCQQCWDTWVLADTAKVWEEVHADDAAELAELEAAAGECESQDDAQTRIQEDAISVRVFGELIDGRWEADKAELLLTTGGPAVRIMCELDQHGEPSRAWLEVQDWFKPWTQYFGAEQDTLLSYCRQFVYVCE